MSETDERLSGLSPEMQQAVAGISKEAVEAAIQCVRSEGLEGKGLADYARSSWSQSALRLADDQKLAAVAQNAMQHSLDAADANGTLFPQAPEYAQGLVKAGEEAGLNEQELAALQEAAPGYAKALQDVAECGFRKMEDTIAQVTGEHLNPYATPRVAAEEPSRIR